MIPGTMNTSRVAVVTGANKGIGFHIALQLATSGLFRSVILGCRDSVRGQEAAKSITDQLRRNTESSPSQFSNTAVSFLPLEVGNPCSHSEFRRALEDQFGGKLDVLVNNAGMAFKGSDPTPFRDQTKPTLDVNFRGTVELSEELLPLLRKGTDPRVVNVASMSGRLGQLRSKTLQNRFASSELTLEELSELVNDFERDVLSGKHLDNGWGNSNYGMSKLAVVAATKVTARDEAKFGIKVNCCCPGYCDTDMTSHKGPRHASEGAKTPVLLATMENCPTGEFFSDMLPAVW